MSINIISEILYDPMYDQANNTVRWNGMNRIKNETVAQHTYLVTLFTRVILEELFSEYPYQATKDRIISETTTYALFHDFDESFTGDIIHPLKYNEVNGAEIRLQITTFLQSCGGRFDTQSPTHKMIRKYAFKNRLKQFQKDIVKIADWLSMLFYLERESELGNKGVNNTIEYCVEMLLELNENLQVRVSNYMRKDVNFDIIKQIRELKS